MITTVIGSLPRLKDDLRNSIRLAVDLQVQIGIDIVSDGEQRTDMISYLSNSMLGVKTVNDKPHIIGKIKPVENIEKVFKIVDFLEARRYIKEKGYSNMLKVGITGPVTFGFSAALNNAGPYRHVRNIELYKDIAYALNRILRTIQEYDGLTQIDEPGMSAGFIAPSLAEEPLNILTEGLDPGLTSIHVCGRLNPGLLNVLSRIKRVDVLSLEFAGSPINVDLLSRDMPKKVGVGCTKSNIASFNDLTSLEQSLEIINREVSRIGRYNIAYIHPDCGLRRTSLDLVVKILKGLVEISRKIGRF